MKGTLSRHWPLYASVVILLLLVWLILSVSLRQNQGHLVYAFDDAYIGMAMARNFSQYGVWGVTRYGFTSCSSPPLWTLLLSLTYYLGGVNQLAPFLLDLVFAILVLALADGILCWYKAPASVRFVTLLGIILLVPLPMLIFSGMEPALQTFVSMLAVFFAARLISGESPGSARGDSVRLLILAPLLTGVRFEGMFLIIAIAALLLMLKRWSYALAFGALGFLPWLVYGIISVSKGWFWLPTSLLLKASLPDFRSPAALILSLLNPIYITLHEGMHMLVLLVSILVVYIMACGKGSGARESRQIMGTILFLTGIAHLEFVGASSLYRYDAYWCVMVILFLGLQLPVVIPRGLSPLSLSTWTVTKNHACGALGLLLFFPLAVKGGRLLWFLPQCTTDVYEQQYQMGLFVRRYYQNSNVALNDIGAVNYLADIRCLDLMGLANAQVAAARRKHTYGVGDIERLSRQTGTRIAIIYDNWFIGIVPPEWIRVGRWTIPNNVNLGGDTVSFYAVDPGEAAHLSESLADFSSQLPAEVGQRAP
ncbi:MAG TPA: hypothetical protein VKO18_18055 [Terriglobia bacterium]|nr:hypothetical protein [Terriglobia bacterium]